MIREIRVFREESTGRTSHTRRLLVCDRCGFARPISEVEIDGRLFELCSAPTVGCIQQLADRSGVNVIGPCSLPRRQA